METEGKKVSENDKEKSPNDSEEESKTSEAPEAPVAIASPSASPEPIRAEAPGKSEDALDEQKQEASALDPALTKAQSIEERRRALREKLLSKKSTEAAAFPPPPPPSAIGRYATGAVSGQQWFEEIKARATKLGVVNANDGQRKDDQRKNNQRRSKSISKSRSASRSRSRSRSKSRSSSRSRRSGSSRSSSKTKNSQTLPTAYGSNAFLGSSIGRGGVAASSSEALRAKRNGPVSSTATGNVIRRLTEAPKASKEQDRSRSQSFASTRKDTSQSGERPKKVDKKASAMVLVKSEHNDSARARSGKQRRSERSKSKSQRSSSSSSNSRSRSSSSGKAGKRKEKRSDDAPQKKTIPLKLWTKHREVGALVGTKGSNLRELMKITGAHIELQPWKYDEHEEPPVERWFVITGDTVEQQRAVVSALMTKPEITFLRDDNGHVVKSGAGQDPWAAWNPWGMGPWGMSGGPAGALPPLWDALAGKDGDSDSDAGKRKKRGPPPEDAKIKEHVNVLDERTGKLIGKHGDTIRFIEEKAGCWLSIGDPTEDDDVKTRTISIRGRNVDDVEVAIKMIKEVTEAEGSFRFEGQKRSKPNPKKESRDEERSSAWVVPVPDSDRPTPQTHWGVMLEQQQMMAAYGMMMMKGGKGKGKSTGSKGKPRPKKSEPAQDPPQDPPNPLSEVMVAKNEAAPIVSVDESIDFDDL